MNQFDEVLQRVLNDNLGNKITKELGNGIYAELTQAYNDAIKSAQEDTEDANDK